MTYTPENWYYSETGEYINHQTGNDTIPKPKINLPEPMHSHSFISINQSTSLLIGGMRLTTGMSNKTHFFNNDNNKWKSGPDLLQSRCYHAAGVLTDYATGKQHVAVVGGLGNGVFAAETLNSVELLLHGENSWIQGTFIFFIVFL